MFHGFSWNTDSWAVLKVKLCMLGGAGKKNIFASISDFSRLQWGGGGGRRRRRRRRRQEEEEEEEEDSLLVIVFSPQHGQNIRRAIEMRCCGF